VCTILVVLVFGALAFRVTQLQALSGDRYRNLALDQRLREIPLVAERGSIFDRNGRDLAISVEQSSVYADPRLVTDAAMYASRLAGVVGVDQATLYERLSDPSRRFVYIARTVDDPVAAQVAALALPGVGFVAEPKRHYPAGDLAGAVIGRVGGEGYGLDGIEDLYEDKLAGTPGEVRVERDQQGRAIPDTERSRVEAQRGTDLVLTLDQSLQYQLERSLVDQASATTAVAAMGIVLDLTTGDVLAMASVEGPSAQGPARPSLPGEVNRPMTVLFEPGSTTKLITIAAAVEAGEVGPQTPLTVPYMYVHGDHTYRDDHFHEEVEWSVTDILRESSNVGTIKIAEVLGKERLAKALRDFGLGEKTAIEFPGQPRGLLIDPDEYYATGLASSAIGYGVAVTAMQMVDVFATIGNDGVSLPPRLVDTMIDADGVRRRVPAGDGKVVVSPETAATMTEMLTEVVRGGTGVCAAVPGYEVAGKTGTANKIGPNGEYIVGATIASFVGFAPADDPRLATIIVLDEPHSQYGSRASAPVFSEVMQWALTRYRVAPTDMGPDAQYDAARARTEADGIDCRVPHGAAIDQLLAERAADEAAAAVAATSTTLPAPAPAPTDTVAPVPTLTE